ncbi:MAG: hypothetical protein ABI480_17260 [Chitinophagaceae bacterium]
MQIVKRKIKQATATRKGKIIFFSLLALIMFAIAGGLLYWQTHKKQIIREQLESAIHGKSDGLYSIRYDSLDLDEASGYLSVKQLHLAYDSNKYLTLRDQDKTPAILLKIYVPEITVTGVKTPKALIDKEIEGTKLELKNPEIEIMYTGEGKDSSQNLPDREIYEQLLGNLNLISIDTVIITGANIRTSNMKTHQTGFKFTNASVQLINVRIDSTANEDASRLFFAKEVMAGCDTGYSLSANGRYNYVMHGVALNSVTRMVTAKDFKLEPRLGEAAFVKSLPTQDDRFDFSIENIAIKNIDFIRLGYDDIIADSVIIGSASFKIYRDLTIPRDKKNRVGTYPQQAIDKIPIPIDVKTILLRNGYVEYKEMNAITKRIGKVIFNNVYTVISNMTNKKELVEKNNIMRADINCRFMDLAPFKVSWLFYLKNPNGRFDLEGNLGSLDAKRMTILTEPMGPARLTDGTINSVYFKLAGNDYSMGGTVKMLYENLKVSLLEKDKDTKKLDKKGFMSFVANIIIKNDNPSGKNKEIRVAEVTNPRNTNRSIFNLSWKTLFKGLKETVGIKK